MRKLIFAVTLGTALAACSPQQAEQAPAEAETLVSGLAIENMDKSIRPGDDFFMYMNGTWIDRTEIPADKGSYGGPQILDDESQENVKAIIDEAASGDFEKGTDEQKIGDLYNAYMDMDTRNAKGIEPLRKHLERIAGIASLEDLARYIAHGRARGLTMPIDLDQLADWNDSSKYSIIITQGGLGLPDREYYLLDDDKSVQIREAYVEHIGRTFDLAGLADGAAAAKTVLALETRLAEHNMPKEQVRDRAAVYNVFSRDQWTDVMPNFPWQAFVDAYGLPEIDTLVIFMPDYLAALDGMLLDTGLETWKVYLTWNELRSAAHLLTADLDQHLLAGAAFERLAIDLAGNRLELSPDLDRRVRLGIEGVDVARPACHVEKDASLRLARKMRRLGREGIRDHAALRSRRALDESVERDRPQRRAQPVEKLATAHFESQAVISRHRETRSNSRGPGRARPARASPPGDREA